MSTASQLTAGSLQSQRLDGHWSRTRTTVTLTDDWSEVGPEVREYIQFPPFGLDHLDHSLQHLAALA